MKKLFLALVTVLGCSGAFAQGKISFQTDSLHLVYYEFGGLAGQGVSSSNMPGVTLVADLYMGTSSTALYLYSTTTFSAVPGKWNAVSVQANANPTTGAPAIPGGTSVFVETQIRDSAFAPPNQFSFPFGTYYGKSVMFTFTLGSSVTYPVMWGASGTWPVGTFDLGSGNKGAIAIITPEPAGFGLVGLATAALTIFRRRK
jgi:hypothetical protein